MNQPQRVSEMSVSEEAPTPARELEPVAVPECDVCAICAEDRETARSEDRPLTVRSLNAVIAGHPHRRRPGR